MGMKWFKNLMFLLCIILLPLCVSCNDTDDVEQIFTGKVWRLTYITDGKSYRWYSFPNVDEKAYKAYDPVSGSRIYTVEFTGLASGGVINGAFKANGSVKMDGSWRADGKENSFSMDVKNRSVTDASDPLGGIIADGLAAASAYSGDDQNLFLHYTYKNPVSGISIPLQLVFTVSK